MRWVLKWTISLLCLFWLTAVIADEDPWFTGPLLAPAGVTVPANHINFEMYAFYTEELGLYNRHGKLIHTSAASSLQLTPNITWGLTDWMDFEYEIPYAINHSKGITGEYIGDVALILGLQVFTQGDSKWKPNLRFTIQEVLPSGRFDELNSFLQGTDGTGMGVYQTSFALNFEHQLNLWQQHYLNTRLSLNYTLAASTEVNGLSTYGGSLNTLGSINPGNLVSVDLSEEFSMTKKLALVIEGYWFHRQSSRFRGQIGNTDGMIVPVGSLSSSEFSLAPAVEYSFSENYGLIAGYWFTVWGKDAEDFAAPVIAFNAYW